MFTFLERLDKITFIKFSFQIHNWTGSNIELYETIVEYFCVTFIPVNFTSQRGIATFYTSSLTLILKIAKFDFMFPHQRNMFTVDILFNDKTSADLFENRISIAQLVGSIVSSRLNERLELDLSNFCNDPGRYLCYKFLFLIFFVHNNISPSIVYN